MASRQPDSACRRWFRRDAGTCGRDARAPRADAQRDSIFTKGPADVLDHVTSEMAIGSKLGIDATKKLTGEGSKRAWPPCGDEALGERRLTLIMLNLPVLKKIDAPFKK